MATIIYKGKTMKFNIKKIREWFLPYTFSFEAVRKKDSIFEFEEKLRQAKGNMELKIHDFEVKLKEKQAYIKLLKSEIKEKDEEILLLKKVINENINKNEFGKD